MAVLESSMERKTTPKYSPKSKKKALLLVQDVNYAKSLAANEEKVRKRSLKYLKKYLVQRSQASPLTQENLQILWKGLFYAMWMSDKPLVQEECAENIAHLIHCLNFEDAMLFFKTGLVTLQNEWIGIDQLRLDKFLMLIRRLLRQAVFVLKKSNFKKHPNEVFAKILEETVLSVTKVPALGLFMHFTEIYLEEIAKVSDGRLQPSRTLDLIKPYVVKLAFANDNRIIKWINKFIFTHLMRQHKLGLEYTDKYKIWKLQRFSGSINQIQKVVEADEEEQDSGNEEPKQSSKNRPLDPRAGRIDVELPQILFNAKDIAEAFLESRSDPRTSKITRNHLHIWFERFQKLHNGIYPLGTKRMKSRKPNLDNYETNVSKAAKGLIKFEQKLLAKGGEKNKRKRDSRDEELDSAVPIKKKKKNVQIENISGVVNSHTNKSNKEKIGKVKSGSNDGTNKTESKQKPEKLKFNKKLKLVESKSTEIKNGLQKKIKEKKIKQRKTTNRTGSISDDGGYDYNYFFKRNSGVWFVTPEVGDKNASSPPVTNQLTLV